MKKQLNLILNGKGGVGKNFLAVNLVQVLKDKAIPFIAYGSDNEDSTLKRFHPRQSWWPSTLPPERNRQFNPLSGTFEHGNARNSWFLSVFRGSVNSWGRCSPNSTLNSRAPMPSAAGGGRV